MKVKQNPVLEGKSKKCYLLFYQEKSNYYFKRATVTLPHVGEVLQALQGVIRIRKYSVIKC